MLNKYSIKLSIKLISNLKLKNFFIVVCSLYTTHETEIGVNSEIKVLLSPNFLLILTSAVSKS
jgi:hypothetical protein